MLERVSLKSRRGRVASPVGGRFGDWSGIPVVQGRRRWGSIVVCTLSIVGLLMGLVVLLMVERLSLTFSGRRLADMGASSTRLY